MAVADPVARAYRRATTYDLARLRSFSDSVFAVAITLLVLTIRLPVASEEADLGRHLAAEWDRYVAYLAGFAVVGYLWLSHHRTFELIVRADRALAQLNLLFLYFLVFLPYPTALLAEYRTLPVALAFFDATVLLVGAANVAIWTYATVGNRLVGAALSRRVLVWYRARALVIPVVAATSLVLTRLAGPAAYLVWLLAFAGRPLLRLLRLEPTADERAAEDRAESAEVDEDDRGQDEDRTRASQARLLSFSDSVYAFAITLLVLRFTVPRDPQRTTTDARLADVIGASLANELIPYTIAFFTLGAFWDLHHRTGLLLRRQDGTLRVINLTHLLVVAVIPLASQLLGHFTDTATALAVFAVTAGAVAATLGLENWWITAGHRLCDPLLPDDWLRLRLALTATTVAFFVASALLAPVLGLWVQVLWFAPFLVSGAALGRWSRRHPAITEAT